MLDQTFCFYLSFIIAASKTLRFSPFSEIATVTTAYNAVTADQLSLSPGQLILVKRKHPDGWWEGELQVMSGASPYKCWVHNGRFQVTLGAFSLENMLKEFQFPAHYLNRSF